MNKFWWILQFSEVFRSEKWRSKKTRRRLKSVSNQNQIWTVSKVRAGDKISFNQRILHKSSQSFLMHQVSRNNDGDAFPSQTKAALGKTRKAIFIVIKCRRRNEDEGYVVKWLVLDFNARHTRAKNSNNRKMRTQWTFINSVLGRLSDETFISFSSTKAFNQKTSS